MAVNQPLHNNPTVSGHWSVFVCTGDRPDVGSVHTQWLHPSCHPQDIVHYLVTGPVGINLLRVSGSPTCYGFPPALLCALCHDFCFPPPLSPPTHTEWYSAFRVCRRSRLTSAELQSWSTNDHTHADTTSHHMQQALEQQARAKRTVRHAQLVSQRWATLTHRTCAPVVIPSLPTRPNHHPSTLPTPPTRFTLWHIIARNGPQASWSARTPGSGRSRRTSSGARRPGGGSPPSSSSCLS